MICPRLQQLPPPPAEKKGWPWSEETLGQPTGRGSNTELPVISIVTPSFNQAPYLEETIRSVLLQGYPCLEYMVIDGGSSDGSVDIIKKYEPWLAYWVSVPDRGQSHAINKGFAKATGEILGWLNSDDSFLPGALLHMGSLARRHPDAPAWVGGGWDIDKFGRRLRFHPPRVGDKTAFADWWYDGYFNQQGCLINRKAYEQVGGLDERLYFLLDVEYWMRLARLGLFITTDAAVAVSRLYAEAKTFQDLAMREVEHIAVNYNMDEREIAKKRLLRFSQDDFGKRKLALTIPQLLHLLVDRTYRDVKGVWLRFLGGDDQGNPWKT